MPDQLSESEWIDLLAATASAPGSPVLGLADSDDAACIPWPGREGAGGELLAISTDSIVEGVHFAPGAPAWWMAQRSLYAAISDLYATGAEPLYVLLEVVDKFLENQYYREFLDNFSRLIQQENITLLGGNTLRGTQRQIHLTALGRLSAQDIKRRTGAKAGDLLALTGPTGRYAKARAAWDWQQMRLPALRPWLGAVRECASACIDISDGLAGDLTRLCRQSGLGARLWLDRLLPPPEPSGQMLGIEEALSGGEDYELCFTMDKKFIDNNKLNELSPLIIGTMVEGEGIELYDNEKESQLVRRIGDEAAFDHFQRPDGSKPGMAQ